MSERSEIQFGQTLIPFVIHRSARRRTVALAVEPAGGLVVTAPAGVTIERLGTLVRSKAPWVMQRLRRAGEQPAALPARELVSGETFRYLGRQYRLRVDPRSAAGDVIMDKGGLIVGTGGARHAEPAAVRGALIRWYRGRAQARLPERVEEWARRFRIDPPAVLIREQRRRWGSCNRAAEIRLNWRIIQAPLRLVDYVVAHELDHVIHDQGHTKAFWAHLGRVMPDYEARRDALRALGPLLEW